MTGYGQASKDFKDKKIIVEVRTLNGKSTDLRFRLPNNYKEKEITLRKIILDKAIRGKLDASITIENDAGEESFVLNKTLFKKYYTELKGIMDEENIAHGDLMQTIMRIPNVLMSKQAELDKEEWETVKSLTHSALDQLNVYRLTEGMAMSTDLSDNVKSIMHSLTQVDQYELERINTVKDRIKKNLEQFLSDEKTDSNRFEQELIYYLEKLDINEEKMRLKQHCDYFLEFLEEQSSSKGKKLAFLSQEMGREINTLGAKAQDYNIQQLVISMKDDLERIKEMIANIV
jgi:uncharacterized protein (TIGR00255 family)